MHINRITDYQSSALCKLFNFELQFPNLMIPIPLELFPKCCDVSLGATLLYRYTNILEALYYLPILNP